MSNDLVPVNRPPRLLHYSLRPMRMRPDMTYIQRHPYGDMTGAKPKGLWLSVEGEDDWKNWCLSEHFRWEALRHTHEVILKPRANILWIASVEALDEFNEKYAPKQTALDILEATGDPIRTKLLLSLKSRLGRDHFGIDWRAVAKNHQGIIIAPYQWERRLAGMMWYYTWDCASGCIWGADAIEEVRLTNERAVTELQIRRNRKSKEKYTRRKMKKIMKRMEAATKKMNERTAMWRP